MTGIWSIDGMARLPRPRVGPGQYLIRAVHYTPELERPIGTCHFTADGQMVDLEGGTQDLGDRRLGFGRAFNINWPSLRHRPNYRLHFDGGIDQEIFRRHDIEASLGQSILPRLEEAAGRIRNDVPFEADSERVKIHVLNVGQGDTILLELSKGLFWLVDAYIGPNKGVQYLLEKLREKQCYGLKKLVISHFHMDHIRAAKAVIQALDPTEVLVPFHGHLTAATRNLIHAAGPKLRVVSIPETFLIGEASLTLFPTKSIATNPNDPNQNALVGCLVKRRTGFFLTGDVPGEMLQKVLCNAGVCLLKERVILKVPHHCSQTAICGQGQMLCPLPTYAVTSCGLGNRYGHPHLKAKQWVNAMVGTTNHSITLKNGDVPFLL